MMAPAAEAGMAHSPAFNRSYPNAAARVAYERPWLVVLGLTIIMLEWYIYNRRAYL